MNLSPESVKKTLLNKVNELSASSWQYTKKLTDFTRNRKISFSDVLLSTISMQKSASKTELLKYFDFNASAPTASALIQQRKKISPEAFDSLFYSFSNAFFLDKTLKGYDPIAVDGSDIYIPRNPTDPDTYRVTDRYNKGFNMIHLNAAYNLLSHLYTDVILQPLNHINEYIAMCDIIDHYTATNPTRKPLFIADALNVSYDYLKHDEITDPSYGIEKMDYIDEVNGQLGEKGARDINEILEANRALFAGGELDEEAKDAFYQAVTKAYLSCKMEAKKTFGRKKKNTETESDS